MGLWALLKLKVNGRKKNGLTREQESELYVEFLELLKDIARAKDLYELRKVKAQIIYYENKSAVMCRGVNPPLIHGANLVDLLHEQVDERRIQLLASTVGEPSGESYSKK